MTYVIAGVSGRTGAAAAEALLAQGKKVRVLVRDQAKGERWASRGAEVAVADLADGAAMSKALAGAQGAYLLAPPNLAVADFRVYQAQVVDALVSAVKSARTPHVVLLSSVGAQHADGTGPIAALHRAEQLFAALPATRTTFLRAAYFMENFGGSLSMLEQGLLPSFTPAAKAFDMIATADIGRTAAALLVEGAQATGVVELGGPARSANDAAAALTKILGKPIKVLEAPLDAVVPTLTGFGFPEILAGMYREMIAAINSGRVVFEGTHRRVQGGTSLEQVLATLLGR